MSLRFAVIADNSRNLNFYGEIYYKIIIPIGSGCLNNIKRFKIEINGNFFQS